jgi:hypothetical protein
VRTTQVHVLGIVLAAAAAVLVVAETRQFLLATSLVFAAILFAWLPGRIVVGASTATAIAITSLTPGLSGGSGIAQFAAATAAGLLVVIAIFRSRRKVRFTGFIAAITALYLVTLLSTVFGATPDWFYLSTACVAYPAAIAATTFTAADRKVFTRALIAMGVILALLASAEAFVFHRLLFAPPRTGQSAHAFFPGVLRAEATAGHPLVLGFLLLVSLMLLSQMRDREVGRLLAGAVLLIGILSTGSSSILLVAVAGLFLIVFLRSGLGGRISLVVVSGGTAAFALAYDLVPAGVFSEFTGLNAEQRLNSLFSVPRLLGMQDVGNILLGNGWGGAEALYRSGILLESRSGSVDNQFVTSVIESGLLGCVALLIALVLAIRTTVFDHRVALICTVIMFLTFDVLIWAMPTTLVLVLAATQQTSLEKGETTSTLGLRELESVGT